MNKSFLLYLSVLIYLNINYVFAGNDKGKFLLPANVNPKDYISNTIIVKYKEIQPFGVLSLSSSEKLKISSIEIVSQKQFLSDNIGQINILDQSRIDKNGLNRIFEITYKAKKNIQEVINVLLEDGNIEYAEPLYINKVSVLPNDPEFISGKQYYLAKVKAEEAWALQADASNVIIAIIDSGSDLEHPDLKDNIHINTGEIPNNNIDDDGDGYIDNYKGWDFVGATSNFVEDNDPNVKADSLDHGVHVSGIASAVTNNGIGVASLAKSAKLMILKAGADNNQTSIYPIAAYKAMKYAADRGAKIINCSWGRSVGPPSAFEQDVINYVLSKGCLIVAAAGNDGNEITQYPAGYNGVFAVGNLLSDDQKASSSSYGYHLALSAPGSGIYNTTYAGNYGYKSGTSMAAPLVSSAAALVAAKYPHLSGIQIGELLRLSTDDIYSIPVNSSYINKLGSGILNVFNALNYGNSPAIRKQNVNIVGNYGSRSPGDTLRLSIDLKNILQPASNLTINLSSTSPNVQILDPVISLGSIQTLESKTAGLFRVVLKSSLQENEEVVFKINYNSSAESYQYSEYFSLIMNLDFINYEINKIKTTVTSNGRIGYSSSNGEGGVGFNYNNNALLYEAALMIGVSSNQVVDNARTFDGNANNHFVKAVKVKSESDTLAVFKAVSIFTDAGKFNRLGLEINHHQLAFTNSNYIIAEYELKNTNSTTLKNVFVGLFTDWDIDESDKNITKYNSAQRFSYAYSFNNSNAPYGGVKLLNNDSRSHYYPLSYMLRSDITSDDDFSEEDKFKTLSSGIFKYGLGEAEGGIDIMNVTGSGPYDIAAGASVKVAFAIIAGDNLASLELTAEKAQENYQLINNLKDETIESFELSQNYPNPVNQIDFLTTVDVKLPEQGLLKIKLYDLVGKEMMTVINSAFIKGIHKIEINTSKLKNGIYYCNAMFNKKSKTIKIVVDR